MHVLLEPNSMKASDLLAGVTAFVKQAMESFCTAVPERRWVWLLAEVQRLKCLLHDQVAVHGGVRGARDDAAGAVMSVHLALSARDLILVPVTQLEHPAALALH
jgi:hypothetical protein